MHKRTIRTFAVALLSLALALALGIAPIANAAS